MRTCLKIYSVISRLECPAITHLVNLSLDWTIRFRESDWPRFKIPNFKINQSNCSKLVQTFNISHVAPGGKCVLTHHVTSWTRWRKRQESNFIITIITLLHVWGKKERKMSLASVDITLSTNREIIFKKKSALPIPLEIRVVVVIPAAFW